MATVVVESGVDQTVRGLPPEWRDCDASTGPQYIGPDHCTAAGAAKLVQRLKAFWSERGVERAYEVYSVMAQYNGRTIWCVREHAPVCVAVAVEVVPPPEPIVFTNPTPRQIIKSIIHETLKAFPDVTYDGVMNKLQRAEGRGSRPQRESEARQACIRAVKAAFPLKSLPELGVIFNLNHTSVLFLLNDEFRARHNAGAQRRQERLRVAA